MKGPERVLHLQSTENLTLQFCGASGELCIASKAETAFLEQATLATSFVAPRGKRPSPYLCSVSFTGHVLDISYRCEAADGKHRYSVRLFAPRDIAGGERACATGELRVKNVYCGTYSGLQRRMLVGTEQGVEVYEQKGESISFMCALQVPPNAAVVDVMLCREESFFLVVSSPLIVELYSFSGL